MSVQVHLPRPDAGVEFTLVNRGITIPSHVESATESQVVLRTDLQAYLRKLGVRPGEAVEVYWQGAEEEQTLPAQITELEHADDVRLLLAVTGPPRLSQRRKAVRAQLEVPVLVNHEGTQLYGETFDLSEAGVRVVVDGWGLPPAPGTGVEVTLTLDDVPPAAELATAPDPQVVVLEGAVVRQQVRRARWDLSMRFPEVTEKTADRLRRRVFRALREERARADG
jgi:c-di-GMP-binding flagellar brake protein YcgR